MPFDFAAVSAPFRMQPGLRRLGTDATQLTPNRPSDRALDEKLAALSGHLERALQLDPGYDPAAALRALSAHASQEHPRAWSGDGTTHGRAGLLGWSVERGEVVGDGPAAIGACLRALPVPWRSAALLALAFAEDFAIIDGHSGRVPWLAVCLPSRWAPEEKVGRHFTQIHAPVADNQMLIAASEQLIRLVTGSERWERHVWTISADPRLNLHPRSAAIRRWPAGDDAEPLIAQAYWRTERQTFIPLPHLRQAVFTIHVESQPLAEVITTGAQAARVHAALASMSPAVLAYRGLTEARERLLTWLDRRRCSAS